MQNQFILLEKASTVFTTISGSKRSKPRATSSKLRTCYFVVQKMEISTNCASFVYRKWKYPLTITILTFWNLYAKSIYSPRKGVDCIHDEFTMLMKHFWVKLEDWNPCSAQVILRCIIDLLVSQNLVYWYMATSISLLNRFVEFISPWKASTVFTTSIRFLCNTFE